ncbi:MAG: site-2 protease family protein [Candidatus Kariarchaeaceae archaeon]
MWQSRLSEFQQLLIAWLVLGFCFSVSGLFNLKNFPLIFISSLIAVGAGFIGHELAHKFIAQRYGWKAGFRLWPQGLLLALFIAVISRGLFIFAAPGAVYLVPKSIGYTISQSKREFGIVSLSGPLMNLVFASIFRALSLISVFSILSTISFYGLFVNLFLAAINMIPFPPLDGTKIFSWNKLIWALLAIPTWLALVYIYL